MKKIITTALIAVMVLSAVVLVSCGSGESKDKDISDSKYVGKWKIASIELQTESTDFDKDWIIELKGDGTGISESMGETENFTWELTDDGFTTSGDLNLDFTEDGDNIVGDLFGAKLVFERYTGEEEKEETEEESENEEAAEPTRFYGGYGYMGDDPVVGAVYEYVATEIAKSYEIDKDTISIPVVCIVDKVENEDGTVDVAGEFQIYNYKLDGDTLLTQSGGSHPGKMHLVKDGEFYKVESFDAVEDGSDYEPSAKKIFGDKYDKFVKASSNDKKMNRLRTKAIKNYVQATGINATQYQDEGWDPVKL